MKRSAVCPLAALLLVVSVATGHISAAEPSPGRTAGSQRPCPDWGMYGRDLARTFSTSCPSPIDATSVAALRPAWVYKTPRTVTASPVVVDGRLYVGAWDGVMYALDAAGGDLLWKFRTKRSPGATFGPIVSSAAVADVSVRGRQVRLVVFGSGPRLYALDATNGKPVWVLDMSRGTRDTPTEFESSPAVHAGTVYAGLDTHNRPPKETGGVRGGLVAVDASTGRLKWSFESEAGKPGKGCGGVWSSPVVDPGRDRVYIATGNCPAGGNWSPYVEAVVALDATPAGRRGRALWSFQPHEPNRRDWDFGATPNLFIDTRGRPTLGAGNKDGAYYALAPDTGKLRWAAKVAEPGDVRDDFSIGGYIGSPAVWQGTVLGGTALGGPPYYHALDAGTGQVVWRNGERPSYAASAAVNGVVFHAALDGALKAYDVTSGRPLWSAPLLGPASSGPAIVGGSVYIGSGTSSSDACAKEAPGSQQCEDFFDRALGATGGIHAFRLELEQPGTGVPARLFSPQANQLDVYDLSHDPPGWQPFIPNAANGGRDLNGEVCAFPDGRHILLGEDSRQVDGVPQGWGVFDLRSRRQVGKLIATYGSTRQPEPYGCAIQVGRAGSIKRIFVTQVGDGTLSSTDGQLIVFFPGSRALDDALGRKGDVCPGGDCSASTESDSDYCILDDDIRTASGVTLDKKGNVYVTESSPSGPPSAAPGRVLLYRGPFPASDRNCKKIEPKVFIQDARSATPADIEPALDSQGRHTGNWYVSSVVFPAGINEYDSAGRFVRPIVPAGFGTPLGMEVDRLGNLYFADIGITVSPASIPNDPDRAGLGPGEGEGSVQRVRFISGIPHAPEVLKDGLTYPDGLGILYR